MQEKSDLMRIYVQAGYRNLDEIRNHYNSFSDGGNVNSTPQPYYTPPDYTQGASSTYVAPPLITQSRTLTPEEVFEANVRRDNMTQQDINQLRFQEDASTPSQWLSIPQKLLTQGLTGLTRGGMDNSVYDSPGNVMADDYNVKNPIARAAVGLPFDLTVDPMVMAGAASSLAKAAKVGEVANDASKVGGTSDLAKNTISDIKNIVKFPFEYNQTKQYAKEALDEYVKDILNPKTYDFYNSKLQKYIANGNTDYAQYYQNILDHIDAVAENARNGVKNYGFNVNIRPNVFGRRTVVASSAPADPFISTSNSNYRILPNETTLTFYPGIENEQGWAVGNHEVHHALQDFWQRNSNGALLVNSNYPQLPIKNLNRANSFFPDKDTYFQRIGRDVNNPKAGEFYNYIKSDNEGVARLINIKKGLQRSGIIGNMTQSNINWKSPDVQNAILDMYKNGPAVVRNPLAAHINSQGNLNMQSFKQLIKSLNRVGPVGMLGAPVILDKNSQ